MVQGDMVQGLACVVAGGLAQHRWFCVMELAALPSAAKTWPIVQSRGAGRWWVGFKLWLAITVGVRGGRVRGGRVTKVAVRCDRARGAC
jgi:hypothetical protein